MGYWLRCAVVALALAVVMPGALSAKAPPSFDRAAFAAQLEKAKAGDASADLRWLREKNAESNGYSDPHWDDASRAFALLDTKPTDALKLAEAQLARDFLTPEAHFVAETALRTLSQDAEAAKHHAFLIAYLRSVRGGTDGASEVTAWNAVSVGEEYFVLNLLGFKPGAQALSTKNGHSYDVMTVTNISSGQQQTIWFNIDTFFGKQFGDLFKD